jgi:hypothetical protein
MAIAASLLIASGVAIRLLHPAPSSPTPAPQPGNPVAVATVNGPSIEAPSGTALAEITITPPATADAASIYPYAEGVVYQPSHVTIACAMGTRRGFH